MKITCDLILVCHCIILAVVLIKCQKYHIVHRGPCLNKTKEFCNSQVPNSFCSLRTNECFCMNGFVSIKEFNRIVCKSLLTDIICRGDHHCTHVKDSICHPGAMRCTCPAETIYVEELHSCVTKYVGQFSLVCEKCKRLGGDCYLIKSESESVSCRCPKNRVNVNWTNENNHYRSMCSGLSVDIGQYCDGKRLICRSKVAKCTNYKNIPLKTCQCPLSYVPIYQEQLDYFECFQKADDDEGSLCKTCRMKEGQCYLREGYGNKHGCKCSNLVTNIFNKAVTKTSNISTKSCLSEYITVSCWFNSIHICFHVKSGFLEQQLKLGNSISFIGKSNYQFSNISSHCLLKFSNFQEESSSFCTNVRVDLNKELPCEMTSIKYSDGSLFQAQLNLWHNRYNRDITRDLKINLSCKSLRNQYKQMTGSFTDKSHKLDPVTSFSSGRLVQFRIRNVYGEVISAVRREETIQLDIELDKKQNDFQSINVEKCSLEAESSLSQFNSSRSNLMISAPKECVDEKENSQFPQLSWNKEAFSVVRKAKSDFFTLQRLNIKENSKLRILCAYSICSGTFSNCIDSSLCGKENKLNSESNNGLMNNNLSKNILLMISVVDLDYVSDSVTHLSPPKTKKKKFCDESICLTDTHMWIISLFCLICIISLIFFIICLWRKVQANPTHYCNSKPDVLLQNSNTASNKNIGLSNLSNSSYQEYDRNYKNLSPGLDENSKPTYISNSLNNVLFFNSLHEKDLPISLDSDKLELVTPTHKSTHSCLPNSACKLYFNYHVLGSNGSSPGNLVCRCQDGNGL